MSSRAKLLEQVYHELRALATAKLAKERPGQTLSATALVHEAFLRIGTDQSFENRGHFYAAASEAMRRILLEGARRRSAIKRGGQVVREHCSLDQLAGPDNDERLLAVNEAFEKFTAIDPLKAEVVKLRFFVGMTTAEVADVLGISIATTERYWFYARAWLRRAMSEQA